MTPDEAIAKIDSIVNGRREITVGLCRITTLHPDEYKNTITEIELYNKIITIHCRLIDLWDYIHKNKGRLV